MTLKIKGCYSLCVIAIFFIPNFVSNLKAADNSFFFEGNDAIQFGAINQNSHNNSTSASFFQDPSSFIFVSPTSVSTWSGCSVAFSVETTGVVDSYQWEVSSDNGITWTFTGSNENTLSLVDVTAAMDQYLYRCRVSKNGSEEVSLSASLTVIAAPEVNAGPDQSICGNGAQNRLMVDLQGSTTASSFSWEVVNGEGQLIDEETLTPSYIVNPKDVGKEVVFRLSITQPLGGCVLTDEMRLTVRKGPSFDVLIDEDGESVPFDGLLNTFSLIEGFEVVSIRYDANNPEIQHQNFVGDNVLINKSKGSSTISRALFDVTLRDLTIGAEPESSDLVIEIHTTQAGGLGENGKNAIEFYHVLGDWEADSVTWTNQPPIDSVKIIPSEFSETEDELPDCEGENCTRIRKKYTFVFTDLYADWYSGDRVNRGLLLKLADESNINTEFIVEKLYNSGTIGNYVARWSTQFRDSVLYLCKDQSIDLEPVSFSGDSLSYNWSQGYGLVRINYFNGKAFIPSHVETGHLTTRRNYSLKGSLDGCTSTFHFMTAPTPVVKVPSNGETTGSLTRQVGYPVAAYAYNLPGLINWKKMNGDGTILNSDQIQPTYQTEISDFGNTIELEVTVYSAKDGCDPEVDTTRIHIFRPLYPYAGKPKYVCSGTSVTLNQAQLANVDVHGLLNLEELEKARLDSIAESYVKSYYWTHNGQGSFDDANLLNPTYIPHSNDDNNFVNCTLHVTDGDAMRSTTVKSNVNIRYTPKPVIVPGSYDAVHVGETIEFNKTIIYLSNRQEWTHNGNGVFTYDSGEVPSYSPAISDLSNENQSVVFSVKAWNACNDDNVAVIVLSILPPTNASAGEDVNICFGEQIQMGAQGGSQYFWSPEVGLSDASIANPVASPSTTTLYTVIIISEHEGVEYSVSDQVLVTVNPLPEANAGADRMACPNTSINLVANNGVFNSSLNYEWFVGDELVSELQSPSFYVDQSKTFRLKVTDEYGCTNEDLVSVQTSIGDTDIQISYPDCSGSTVQVSVSGFESVSWQPAASFACPLCATTSIINPDPDQVYVFSGIAGSCVVEKEFRLPLKPGPVITGLAYYEICPGMPVEFDLSAQSTGYSYSWEPSEGLSSNSVLNPEAMPLETTGYTLKATDGAGCVSETDVLVRVVKMPELNLSGALDLCRGSSIDYKINRQNASSVEWIPSKGVSNPYGFFTTLSPDVNTTYKITVSNGNCKVSGQLEVKVLEVVDARFSYSYPGLTVSFTPIVDEGLSYLWDFGDGQTLNSAEPEVIHTYSGEGDYPVCLKISGSCGTHEHCATVKVRASDPVNCD